MMVAAPASILLVEDSDTQALQLTMLLEGEGMRVDRAASAETALEMLNTDRPDLLIVDYRLPGMNGDELARRVRMNAQMRAMPILMLTDERDVSLEQRGLDSGASAYVPKSADRDLLLARLKALLKRGGAAARSAGEASAAIFRRAELLVVEESATYRLFLADLLTRDGYLVREATTPAEALTAIPGGSIDSVLVGLDAHGFDPFDLCRAIVAQRGPDSGGFELIGLGGDSATEGFAAGADDVFPKRGDRDTLLARVRAAVRRKLIRDEEAVAATQRREQERVLAVAQAEAAAADALGRANQELAATNARLEETQAQLVQAAKMASLGELVAGIAHELNNPLAFIMAHRATVERLVGEARSGVDADARLVRAADRLDAMRVGLGRIEELVTKLRTFSRFEEGGAAALNVPAAIDDVLKLLAPKLGRAIVVDRCYDAPDRLVASPALINQVVMNFVSNAADAIGEKEGRIAISTSLDHDRYRIAVGDSGPGVPDALRDRVFEPFFTTKDVGSGTGLGLAIAYGIVHAQHGTITIGTSGDGGALFALEVPASAPA